MANKHSSNGGKTGMPRKSAIENPVAAPSVPPVSESLVAPRALAAAELAPVVDVTPPAPVPVIETAEAVVTAAAENAADIMQKEETIMATNFETANAEAPKMLNDMNDRAKTAMEKGSKMVEELNDFAKGNVEAMVESSRIAARGVETLGQDVADYTRRSFEGLTATLKSLASVKSPTEFFKLQSDYMRSSFDAAVAQSSKSTEAMIKLTGDASQPISTRFAVAAEKVKTAA